MCFAIYGNGCKRDSINVLINYLYIVSVNVTNKSENNSNTQLDIYRISFRSFRLIKKLYDNIQTVHKIAIVLTLSRFVELFAHIFLIE